jgi:hypothetical protein
MDLRGRGALVRRLAVEIDRTGVATFDLVSPLPTRDSSRIQQIKRSLTAVFDHPIGHQIECEDDAVFAVFYRVEREATR